MNPMQPLKDPAAAIAPQLLQHIHLVSRNRYPLTNNPSLDTIAQYLLEAPKVVRDIAPMQWQFLDAPQDGTLILVWQPLEHLGTQFASDGYVWSDAEQTFNSDYRGYTLQMFQHRSGYKMPQETMATHSRRRYRLLPANPNMPSPDPSLFLVHYSKAHGRDTIPAASIPVLPQVAAQLQARRSIQAQGQLARKDFMLHDRSNWPTINAPQAMARQQMQAGHGRAASIGMNEASLEEEEDVSRGDILDFMSPRDISRIRYEQHHEWMEEILESPYNIYQIVPGDLGLGRKGELEELTKDFFDAPITVMRAETEEPATAGKIEKTKAHDFTKHANQKIEDMQADIERMKQKHAKRMARMQRSSFLNAAEKRLRTAPIAGDARSMSHGSLGEPQDTDALDEIANEVEDSLGKKIEKVANVVLVDRGGLEIQAEKERQPSRTFSMSSANRPVLSPVKNTASPSMPIGFPPQIQQQSQNGMRRQPVQPASASANEAAVKSAGDTPASSTSAGQQSEQPLMLSENQTPAGGSEAREADLPTMDDTSMDVDLPDLGDDQLTQQYDKAAAEGQGSDWVMVDQAAGQDADSAEQPTVADQAPPDINVEQAAGEGDAPKPAQPVPEQSSAQHTPMGEATNTPGMDNNEFGEAFDSVDVDTAGDALASYGNDNDEELKFDGMDDSAFGDAFHHEDQDIS